MKWDLFLLFLLPSLVILLSVFESRHEVKSSSEEADHSQVRVGISPSADQSGITDELKDEEEPYVKYEANLIKPLLSGELDLTSPCRVRVILVTLLVERFMTDFFLRTPFPPPKSQAFRRVMFNHAFRKVMFAMMYDLNLTIVYNLVRDRLYEHLHELDLMLTRSEAEQPQAKIEKLKRVRIIVELYLMENIGRDGIC